MSWSTKVNKGVSEDIIDMELTLFRPEARMIRGFIYFDPARWWVRNSSKFPLMSQLSMIYLLDPASHNGTKWSNPGSSYLGMR